MPLNFFTAGFSGNLVSAADAGGTVPSAEGGGGLVGAGGGAGFSGTTGLVGEAAQSSPVSKPGVAGIDGSVVCPFSLTRFFCALTRSASRLAAASSWRLVSSGSSFSASRAAYAASRSIREMTICLMLTLGWSWAVAERNGPRLWRWKSSVKTCYRWWT